MNNNRSKNSLIGILVLLFLTACDIQDGSQQLPPVLKVGVLPDESEAVLVKRYTPLFEHISQQLGIKYQFIFSNSYSEHLKMFEKGEIHLAYFGGLTFLQAHHSVKAVPIVMRDIDLNFASYFIVNKKSGASTLQDLRGKSFSFGSRLSTSGHLMPRYFMKEKGINPELFFSRIIYTGAHDKTVKEVESGSVDAGVVNAKIVDKMLIQKKLDKEKITIIWQTPPYPDYIWAMQPGYSEEALLNIRNSFLMLSVSNKLHEKILYSVDAGGFLPASIDDFDRLMSIAHELNLFERDGLN